jgi:hypothetical protein
VGILQPKRGAGYDQLVADMIAPTPRSGHLAEIAMDDNGVLLICDSRADRIYQFDTQKRELIKSWPARGDGAADMALDQIRHRLFVGTRTPPEMTVYDSMSGNEIQNLPGPETMDGVHYDTSLKRVYMSGGRWYGTPEASPGWIFVYEQKDSDHYEVISKIKTRPGSATSLFLPARPLVCRVPSDRRSRRRNLGIRAAAMTSFSGGDPILFEGLANCPLK